MATIPFHPKFRLNGISYSEKELKAYAYDCVKEGEPYKSSIGVFMLDWLSNADNLTVHTSGATGTPKAIIIKKEHMVNSALATGSFFGLQEGNTVLHCLPTDFIAGKMMLVRAMVLGLHIRCLAPTSSPLDTVNERYDFAAMVPLQLRNSLQKIDCIRSLIVGGAPFSEDLKQLVARSSTRIFETYGMTETVTHVAVKQINHLPDTNPINLNLFRAVPHVNFSLDDRDCLVITAPKVTGSEVVTNDVVDLISPTAFRWLGRYDNVINSGGIKLIPEQIEAALSDVLSQRFFVAGLPDEVLGQKLVLLLEGNVDISQLSESIGSRTGLSKYQIPKSMYILPKFVETETGKIQRTRTLELIGK